MKKLFLTFSFLIPSFIALAQGVGNNDGTISVGVAGGVNEANLQVASAHRGYVLTGSEPLFSLGITVDFKSNPYFSVRPGIFYSGRGGTLNAEYTTPPANNVYATDEYRLHYIAISIPLIGHIPFQSGANIFLGAGPFYAYALNGTNLQSVSGSDPVVQKVTFGSQGDFTRNDVGAATAIGFETASGFSLGGNVDFGLTNIMQRNTTGFDATKLKTVTFYFSIGRRF